MCVLFVSIDVNAGNVRACVRVMPTLCHWCCLATSHYAPSLSLSRSTAVARTLPPIPGAGLWQKQQLSKQPLS